MMAKAYSHGERPDQLVPLDSYAESCRLVSVSGVSYKVQSQRMPETTEVRSNLAELRARRGLGAAELAARTGISRQTVYAIEAGSYVPNTAVSLRLARVLETTVEDLFELDEELPIKADEMEVTILGDTDSFEPGQILRLCSVDRRVVAVVPESGSWGLPPADAVLLELSHRTQTSATAKVRILGEKWRDPSRILMAGCDPSASILAQAMQAQGGQLVIAYENSSRALDSLKSGLAHIAGTHLVDKVSGKMDLTSITRLFGRNTVAVFSYAIWEEGLVVATGNPKRITSIGDLARKDVSITNREHGAGCRRLLDDLIALRGIQPKQIRGYDSVTVGHLPAARRVRSGEVDCCISTQAVARALALEFIPLAQKPYHLVVRRRDLDHPTIRNLLATLGRAAFRKEVESYAGYSMRTAGEREL